jgi:hypothetical protein
MTTLDQLYCRLLAFGLLGLREAIRSADSAWAEAEVEFLHNVPSLLGEPNPERHRCFWALERERYIAWVRSSKRERPISRLRTYYEPVLTDIEPLIQSMESA